MSQRFEEAIKKWYDTRPSPLNYLNLEFPKPILFSRDKEFQLYCFTNQKHQKHEAHTDNKQLNLIVDQNHQTLYNCEVIWDRLSILSNVTLKNFHKILEFQQQQGDQLEKVKTQVHKLSKHLASLDLAVTNHQPLTKTEVKDLVLEIAEQPKLVEKEALLLTEELKKQVLEVKHAVSDLKKFIAS